MIQKKKIVWLTPFLHPVYEGWIFFRSKYFDLTIYTPDENKEFNLFLSEKIHFHKLEVTKNHLITKSNFFCFFDVGKINLKKGDFIICGDIFTNNLPFKIKGKNVFYYSEYFGYEKKFVKNLIFYFIGFLFFYNKKIFVPTELAYKTFSKISKNVFYFPQIYYGEICKNKHNDKNEIKLFCVVRNIDSWMKNIGFLIDNFCYFIERDRIQLKISLTLVGEMNDKNFLDKYYKYIKKGTIKYLPRVLREELGEIYSNHDIFILPSKSDPIGAVVQEAMSNGLAILVSDRVGASSYIENGKNGCIFSLDKDGDFSTKLEQIIQNLDDYKQNSLRILEEKYRYKNEKLMEEMYSNFSNFLMK